MKNSYTNIVVGVIIITFFVTMMFASYFDQKHQTEVAKLKAHCIENAQATNTDPENCNKITR